MFDFDKKAGYWIVRSSFPSPWGGGGGGGGGTPKDFFSALRDSVWSKNKGGGHRPPRAPPLDPLLLVKAMFIPYRKAFRADMKNCPV